ncbi:thiol-disulfide oxidoreductase ResA [Aquibacillus saliphilus]|uniref:thiol-disulfide oxidoreductase ResA n=1 Tax=Aquibacillus saliphilus TaxID=1909422 RepID=UPI001CEFF1CB|nr:thiol-disulfide oxidoreductase ResA [Aquibacillus saliphilus]
MNKIEEAKITKSKKKRRRLLFRSIILVILLAAVVFALVSNLNKDDPEIGVGDQAPNFKLKQLNGTSDSLSLDELKGKGVMLNFWATYCKPCEQEMPYMESLYPKYKDNIEIVAVSLDTTELVIDRFVDKYQLTFPILHDNKGQVLDLYNIVPLPTTLFIDEDGVIVDIVSGGLTLDRIESYLKKIQPD